MANQIEVEILLEVKAATAAVKEIQKQVDDMSKKAVKSIDTIDIAIGNLAASLAKDIFDSAIKGAKELFNFLVTDGVAAAQEQEDAINRLNVALQSTGRFSAQTSKDLQEYAQVLQETTRFSSGLVLENMALLQSLTDLSTEGLKDATQAAIDMAAALQIDLRTATMAVAKAAEGNVGALQRYGVEVRKGTDDAETFANALDALNAKFGGTAAASVNTFAGSMDVLKNSLNDLQQSFGDIIIKNPAVISAIQEMNEIVQNLKIWIDENKESVDGFVAGIAKLAVVLADLTAGVVKETINAFTQLKLLWEGFVTLMGGLTGDLDQVKLGIDKMTAALVGGTGVTGEYNKVLEEKARLTEMNAQADAAYAKVNAEIAKENEDALNKRKENEKKLKIEQDKIAADNLAAKEAELAAERQHQQELLNIQKEFVEAAALEKAAQAEMDLIAGEEGKEFEKEFLQAKLDELALIKMDARIKEAEAEGMFQEAMRLMREKALLQQQQLEREGSKASLDMKKKAAAEQKAMAQDLTYILSSIAKEGSKESFMIAKAGALAQSLIDLNLAIANANAIPWPANIPAIISATAIGVRAIQTLTSSKGPSFAYGGIVPGNSFSGDRVHANVNSGEMVLNRRQQENLFEGINNGDMGGGGVTINVQGNVMADNDYQVDLLIDRINNALEFRNAKFVGVA